jgi:hypothetical protein
MENQSSIGAFNSLQELQAVNLELRSSLDVGTPGGVNRIAELIRQAVSTGKVLDHREDRRAAQDIINYWFAQLNVRERADGLSTELGKDFDTLLADFDPTTLDMVLPRADEWLSQQSGDTQLLSRQILVRMFRLNPEGNAILSRIQRPSLDDLEPRDAVDQILESMKRIGVINTTKAFDGTEELWLRSDHFFANWQLLQGLVHDRQAFRAQANRWSENKPGAVKVASPVDRFVRRQLNSIGKRLDWFYKWVGIRFAGGSKAEAELDAIPAESDYYRDRSKNELDYLFHRKNSVQEFAEWERIVRALSFLLLVTVAVVIATNLISVLRQNAAEKRQRDAIQRLEELQEAADHRLATMKRERQRLKEYIAIVHSIAEYKELGSKSDARGEAALWRLITPPETEAADLAKISQELKVLGLEDVWESVWRPQVEENEPQEAVSDDTKKVQLEEKLSGVEAQDVAVQVSAMIDGRTNPNNETGFDKDTLKYILNSKKRWCTASGKLVQTLVDKFATIDASSGSSLADFLDTVSAYIIEFEILNRGEMTVGYPPLGGSQPVSVGMRDFHEAIDEFDLASVDFMCEAGAVAGSEIATPLTVGNRSEGRTQKSGSANVALLRKEWLMENRENLPTPQQTLAEHAKEIVKRGEKLIGTLKDEDKALQKQLKSLNGK